MNLPLTYYQTCNKIITFRHHKGPLQASGEDGALIFKQKVVWDGLT